MFSIDEVTVVYISSVYKLISAWSKDMLEVLVHDYCIHYYMKAKHTSLSANFKSTCPYGAHANRRATRFSTWSLIVLRDAYHDYYTITP